MNIFLRIFLFVASSIVLLHNLLPHNHHYEEKEMTFIHEFETDQDDILDPFWLAFHNDAGSNLEHILPTTPAVHLDFTPENFLLPDFNFHLAIPLVEKSVTAQTVYKAFYFNPYFWESSTLRGPPAC